MKVPSPISQVSGAPRRRAARARSAALRVFFLLPFYFLLSRAALGQAQALHFNPQTRQIVESDVLGRNGVQATVTPEQFGAVGDDSTDDAKALLAAVAAASVNNGTIVLGPKTYLTSKPLASTRAFSIRGCGPSSVILMSDASAGGTANIISMDAGSQPAVLANGIIGPRLENFSIQSVNPRYSLLSSVTVTVHGSGYTSTPTVTISGGGGTGATATCTVASNNVQTVTITNHGTGYTTTPTIGFTGGGGSGATAVANMLPSFAVYQNWVHQPKIYGLFVDDEYSTILTGGVKIFGGIYLHNEDSCDIDSCSVCTRWMGLEVDGTQVLYGSQMPSFGYNGHVINSNFWGSQGANGFSDILQGSCGIYIGAGLGGFCVDPDCNSSHYQYGCFLDQNTKEVRLRGSFMDGNVTAGTWIQGGTKVALIDWWGQATGAGPMNGVSWWTGSGDGVVIANGDGSDLDIVGGDFRNNEDKGIDNEGTGRNRLTGVRADEVLLNSNTSITGGEMTDVEIESGVCSLVNVAEMTSLKVDSGASGVAVINCDIPALDGDFPSVGLHIHPAVSQVSAVSLLNYPNQFGPNTFTWDNASITLGNGSGATNLNLGAGGTLTASAFTDTTNATNITSGVLGSAEGGAGTVNGYLKSNGSGTVSAATTTGSGNLVLATSPTLTTPTLGAASATSITVGGGATLLKTLSATATLDFPSTNAQNSSDLTITVTGAALNDTVCLGVPNGSTLTNSSFSAWVSSSNTVTVRFNNFRAARNRIRVQRGPGRLSSCGSGLPPISMPCNGYVAVPRHLAPAFFSKWQHEHSAPTLGWDEVALYRAIAGFPWGYEEAAGFPGSDALLIHYAGAQAKAALLEVRSKKEEGRKGDVVT